MVYAPLAKLKEYRTIPYLDAMLKFMAEHDLMALPTGEHDIVGRDLFLRVFRYAPREAATAKFETHRLYGDVHIVLKGVENIQTVRSELLMPATEYDEAKDIQFFTADRDISDIIVGEQEFAYFAAGESHKPMCRARELSEPIAKFVFKIKER